MKNILFKAILFVGILMIGGASAVKSQTILKGRYIYQGRGANPPNFVLTFERENSVYLSYIYNGAGTIEGNWTRKDGFIRAVFTRGNAEWTFVLKPQGADLELTKALLPPQSTDIPELKTVLPAGTLFEKDRNKPSAPELSAANISNRIIKLLKSIKTPEDISPENITRQTDLKVSFNEKTRSEYGFGGYLKESNDWTYGLLVYPYPSKNNNQADTLRFSFDYQLHEPSNPEMPAFFQNFNLGRLSKELQAAGFSAPSPRYAEHGTLRGYSFSRGTVRIDVSTGNNSLKSNEQPATTDYVEMVLVSLLNS